MTGEEIEIKKENQVTEKAATGIKNYVQEEKETVGEIEIITGLLSNNSKSFGIFAVKHPVTA